MSVRFSKMWACIAVWLFLDLLMIKFGRELPMWLYFDGKEAFYRDFWIVWFIAFMWLMCREPSASPVNSQHSAGEVKT